MSRAKPINGGLLAEDRASRRISREALVSRGLEAGHLFSISTLRRAEGGWATAGALLAISQTLGFAPNRYADPAALPASPGISDISGEWVALYLEQDVLTAPYLSMERLFVKQVANAITGAYEPYKSSHPDGDLGRVAFEMVGAIEDDVILGTYRAPSRPGSRGSGAYQLKLTREGYWAEGFCLFAGDDGKIAFSRNIWIRRNSPTFHIMLPQAEKLMTSELLFLTAPIS